MSDWAKKWLTLEPWHPDIIRMSRVVEGFCSQAFRNKGPHIVVLAGPSGNGKTHAMRRAHYWITQSRILAAEEGHWKRPAIVQWTDWPHVMRCVVEGEMHMAEGLYDSMGVDILFLDDIGAESDKFRSGENVDALCQLLSRRERKWTLISTNFRPMQWDEHFDARVADRLCRSNATICDMECGSYSNR
jgi:hypothetical protein